MATTDQHASDDDAARGKVAPVDAAGEDAAGWLTEAQQRAWRGWLAVAAQLPTALHRQLHDDSGLSLQDFDVLVQLSEADGARRRITDLAAALGWERSRLSHHVKRMQGRGLVEREDCADDGRTTYVVLTPAGRAAIEAAAPSHVATVRDLFFADATPDELAALSTLTTRILSRLPHPTPRD